MFERFWRAWHRRDVEKRIRRHGWTAIYVGDYSTAPTWAYTIGFQSSLGAPEIIVFDLPEASANDVFHEAFRQIKAGDLVIRDNEPWALGGDGRLMWRKVHPSRFVGDEEPWLGIALTFHTVLSPESGDFEAFQLVLSDTEGRLPWEDGYDERLRPRQRALYEPASPRQASEPAAPDAE